MASPGSDLGAQIVGENHGVVKATPAGAGVG
jgi:hypothetical protein